MKTCRRFATIRAEHEREIGYLEAHSVRHAGKSSARSSAKQALSGRHRMARALNQHITRCPECG